ncbi:MAG: hypothetical protein LKK55_07205 [Olsenella sp.]|jgi:hypothetical protein|nr:hypothetical protein [Olsenella sp.]MCI2184474.1 hypothetical protein [Olsenella sp.]
MMRTQRRTEDEYERGISADRAQRLGLVAGLGGAVCTVATLLLEVLGNGKPLGEEWAHGRNGDEELARCLGKRNAGSARPRPTTR